MNSRRTFLKYTGATTLTLFAYSKLGGLRQAIAQIPGGTLDPGPVSKFVTPLLIPPVMPKAGTDQAQGWQERRLLRDCSEAVRATDLPAGLSHHDRMGIWVGFRETEQVQLTSS